MLKKAGKGVLVCFSTCVPSHIHGRLAASLPPSPSVVVYRGGRGGTSVHSDIQQGSPVEAGHNVPCASLYEMRPDDSNMRGARYTYTLPDADNLPLSPVESWTPSHDEMTSQPKTRFHVMTTGARSVWSRLRALLTHVFLPAGYPSSVAPEYLRYQLWHVLQDITTYLRGILATKAVLEGMGVGKGGATALGATLQWMARDGASMMSGLVFTTLVSTDFNRNIKPWRLFADFIVDVGITLEMLAPAFPRRFVLLICLASVCKTMCGIAAGSVNGVIVEHLARSENIGDVVAKGGAQHTAVNMFGLSFSVLFAHVANVSPRRVWTAYITLTVIHLLANYRAMRALALRSLNRSRTEVLIAEFQRSAGGGVHTASPPAGLDPEAVGRREKILGSPLEVLGLIGPKIRLGVRLKELAASGAEVRRLQGMFQKEPYMVNQRGRQVVVALRSDATKLDQLRAYFNAVLLRENVQSETAVQTALSKTRASFPEFVALLERQGWDLSRVLLGTEGWVFTGGADTETQGQAVKGG